MRRYVVSNRATGWYFPETLHHTDTLQDPAGTPPTPPRDELIAIVSTGLELLEREANAEDPSPLTTPIDIVDTGD